MIISDKELIRTYKGTCSDCGSEVNHYCCNADLVAKRPEADDWDWWTACSNEQCKNHYGEGIFQSRPDWDRREPK